MANHLLVPLLAQNAPGPGAGWSAGTTMWIVIAAVLVLIAIVIIWVIFSYFQLWLQARLTSAKVGFIDLIGMHFRKVDYPMIVRQKIALVQAGVKVDNRELEAHYLARGNV